MKSILKKRRESEHVSNCQAAHHDASQLRVNVIATTNKATVRALRTATCLAVNLGAQIALIAVEVVPSSYLLHQPPVPVSLLERRLCGLVYEAGIFEKDIRIQLCLCCDQRTGLQRILQPHSLVVLGGHEHWWSRRDRNLKELLIGCGHQVIAAEVGPGSELGYTDKRTDVAPVRSMIGRAKQIYQ